jgi:peptidoglycan hydrolase-like protein with peptidoglycan-binding domain
VRNVASKNRGMADAEDEDSAPDKSTLRAFVMRVLMRNPRDSFVAILAAAAVAAIFINGLFLQPGPHPAPIFAVRPPPIAAGETTGGIVAMLPRPRPAEAESAGQASSTAARTRGEIISDIQRELTRRGFYDGAVDGIYGAKTDASIRDFEQAVGLKPSAEPSEALLQSILRSSAKAPPSVRAGAQKDDAIATLLASSRQVLAIQRALSEYGYGPLKPTGIYDADTRATIERFERDRKLPITGQISERVTRELAGLTGRPLE